MKIAYVVKRYPRFSETFIVNEILAHEEAGVDVMIFALRPPCDTHFQDAISKVRAPVIYLPSDGPKGAALWNAITQGAERLPELWSALHFARDDEAEDVHQSLLLALAAVDHGVTHFHAHFATVAATVARLASKFSGIPYTFTAHAKDIFHESVCPHELERKLADAAATITVSDFNVSHLRDTYSDAAARVERIYNGLDLGEFPFASPRDRQPCIIAVGRLVEKKGFGDLVEACAILRERGVEFACEIIGTGECEQALRRRIEELRLADWVQLLGARPQSEVKQHLQASAVCAVPCVIGEDGNRDGLPTVLLEAMALGTPCVSTDVTGIPEVIQHERTGLTVPQHDPPSLADALQRLLADSATRVELAKHARQLIVDEFQIQRNAARQREVFASAAGTQRRRHGELLQDVPA